MYSYFVGISRLFFSVSSIQPLKLNSRIGRDLIDPGLWLSITKTCLFKYIENFTTKNRKLSGKNSVIFQISARNIDCGYPLEPLYRGGSNEYTQSMFLSRNKKNNVYPCKPQFYYSKVGLKGVKII